MEPTEVKSFVNKIFKRAGRPPVTKLATEFADGIRFQELFNLLYDEKIDCKLVTSAIWETRLTNWNRINANICFNYLQQKFYLMEPTMIALAKGN